jgi:hypothetical protein
MMVWMLWWLCLMLLSTATATATAMWVWRGWGKPRWLRWGCGSMRSAREGGPGWSRLSWPRAAEGGAWWGAGRQPCQVTRAREARQTPSRRGGRRGEQEQIRKELSARQRWAADGLILRALRRKVTRSSHGHGHCGTAVARQTQQTQRVHLHLGLPTGAGRWMRAVLSEASDRACKPRTDGHRWGAHMGRPCEIGEATGHLRPSPPLGQ